MELSLNPLDQLNAVVVLATMLIFGATFVTLRKVFVLPYLKVMEAREGLIEGARARIAESADLETTAEQDGTDLVAEARMQADEMLASTAEEAEAYRKKQVDAAQADAARRLEAGRAAIEKERESGRKALRREALECVGLACEQLLGRRDEASATAAVDRLLARRAR